MEKIICPVCGEKLNSRSETVDLCSKCAADEGKMEESRMMTQEIPDAEVYLNARDYSAPENYPGY